MFTRTLLLASLNLAFHVSIASGQLVHQTDAGPGRIQRTMSGDDAGESTTSAGIGIGTIAVELRPDRGAPHFTGQRLDIDVWLHADFPPEFTVDAVLAVVQFV